MAGLRQGGGSAVREVRGRGLLIGVEMAVPAGPVIEALKEAGVLTIAGGGDTVRFLPPLIISEAEADEVIQRATAVFQRFAP